MTRKKLLWLLLGSRIPPGMTRFVLPSISITIDNRVTSVRITPTQLIIDKIAATKNDRDGQLDILSFLITSHNSGEAQLIDHMLTLLVSGWVVKFVPHVSTT